MKLQHAGALICRESAVPLFVRQSLSRAQYMQLNTKMAVMLQASGFPFDVNAAGDEYSAS